jgi:hypothetical protein
MSRATANKKFLANNPTLRAPHMEHIRNVKAEMFYHEGLAECSVNARYAWIGLWTQSDKFGRFPWKPKFLKSRIMPFDNVDFESLMIDLANRGFIERYTVDGQNYGFSPNWSKHQAIGTREKQSTFAYPAPPSALHSASTVQAPSAHSADIVPAQEPHRAKSVEVEVGVDVGMGKEIGIESESKNQNTAPRSRASADTPLSLSPKSSADSTDDSLDDFSLEVDSIVERAMRLSDGRVRATKTGLRELRDAVARVQPPVDEFEIEDVVKAHLSTCKDDFAFNNFYTALAANWVATIRLLRERSVDEWEEAFLKRVRKDADCGVAALAQKPQPACWHHEGYSAADLIRGERERRAKLQKATEPTVAPLPPVQEAKPEVADDDSADVIVEEGEMNPAEWLEYFRRRLRGDFAVLNQWTKENPCPAECREEFIRLFEEEQQRRKK